MKGDRKESVTVARSALALCCGVAATVLIATIGGAVVVNMTYPADALARARASPPGSVDYEGAIAAMAAIRDWRKIT